MKKPNLKTKRVHMIGIGGNALVYLAQILHSLGFEVSGCDLVDSPNLSQLRKKGIKVQVGHSAGHLNTDIDEVIISSAINLQSPAGPELVQARKLSTPIVKRDMYWRKLMQQGLGIAVAGTHGKTTTTAMIGVILEKAGLDPTVMVGGYVPEFAGNVRIGKLEYIVIEADEYDRAFLKTCPQISVITNIDSDHLDCYPGGLPEIRQAFKKFVRLLPAKKGVLVAFNKDPNIREITKSFDLKFRFYDEEHIWPGLKLKVPGLHNRLNATAAAKVAHELGIESRVIQKALNNFQGVARRQEYLGRVGNCMIFDDYAHLPKEVESTISSFREAYPDKKILVLYQPHQKLRTKENLKGFAETLKLADQTLIAPLFFVAGREENIKVSSKDIEKVANDSRVQAFNKWEDFNQARTRISKKYEIIIIMGAGDLSEKMKKRLFK